MESLFSSNKQFILGVCCGLIGSISLSLWNWNRNVSLNKLVEKKLKKKIRFGEMKMAFVVRKDLKLTRCELCTQIVYACVGVFKENAAVNPSGIKKWKYYRQIKIAVKVNDETELLAIQAAANKQNLVNYLVRDSDSSKNNALLLCIGPDSMENINLVTGHLKLY